ncbi:hypothetical protein FIBSPDRAFT_854553 [Athelia psychrophila]|uniref:Uncharacterized protein n=1 Tax=Athelia psychrophila TaxID=1759441 RepID=A0A166Q7K5_9AGAM|nr:hypothetical protein FIBSPDRAFT_854553 [Fibularhizoctonia sp. CBS 109695]
MHLISHEKAPPAPTITRRYNQSSPKPESLRFSTCAHRFPLLEPFGGSAAR